MEYKSKDEGEGLKASLSKGGGLFRASPASAINCVHRTRDWPCEAWSLHGCFVRRCLSVLLVDPLLEHVVLLSNKHLSGWPSIVPEARQVD